MNPIKATQAQGLARPAIDDGAHPLTPRHARFADHVANTSTTGTPLEETPDGRRVRQRVTGHYARRPTLNDLTRAAEQLAQEETQCDSFTPPANRHADNTPTSRREIENEVYETYSRSTWEGLGVTALHLAVIHGDTQRVQQLLAQPNLPINQVSRLGSRYAPLHMAARSPNAQVVQLLLNTRGIDLHVRNKTGMTPLHVAALKGHPGIIKLLLRKGANLHITNDNGQRPADLAHPMVKELLIVETYMDGIRRRAAQPLPHPRVANPTPAFSPSAHNGHRAQGLQHHMAGTHPRNQAFNATAPAPYRQRQIQTAPAHPNPMSALTRLVAQNTARLHESRSAAQWLASQLAEVQKTKNLIQQRLDRLPASPQRAPSQLANPTLIPILAGRRPTTARPAAPNNLPPAE